MLKRAPRTLLVVALTLLAIEIVLRQLFGNLAVGELFQFHPGDGRCVALRPGTAVEYTGHWLRTDPVKQEVNEQGFRGPKLPEKRGTCETRVALLGDSFTYGVGVAATDTIAARLALLFEQQRDRQELRVINFGVPAFNLDDARRHWEAFARRWTPDVVLYFLWSNDLEDSICSDGWAGVFASGSIQALARHVYIVRIPYILLMTKMRMSRQRQDEPEALRLEMLEKLQMLRAGVAGDAASFGVVILGYPVPREQRQAALAALTRLDVPVLDVSDIVRRDENRLPRDGHLSVAGNQRVSEAVHAWLAAEGSPWLKLMNAPRCAVR